MEVRINIFFRALPRILKFGNGRNIARGQAFGNRFLPMKPFPIKLRSMQKSSNTVPQSLTQIFKPILNLTLYICVSDCSGKPAGACRRRRRGLEVESAAEGTPQN